MLVVLWSARLHPSAIQRRHWRSLHDMLCVYSMFVQFFCKGHPLFAWTSLLLLLAWQAYLGLFRRRLNDFYGEFYDSLTEVSSGAEGEVATELRGLCTLILPVVLLSSPLRFLRQVFVLQWRLDLCRSYTGTETWSSAKRIEGASQRVQEDTSRLAAGISGAVFLVVDTLLTIGFFSPLLLEIGQQIAPPPLLSALGAAWLMVVALTTAAVGLVGALLLGRPLVSLEVANQRVEGHFRSQLVLSEHDVGNETSFLDTLRRVRANYMSLYRVTALLNLFLSVLEQAVLLLPLVLVSPRVVTGEVSLGLLIRASDAFSRVFSAFSVLADHVPAINDFVSVYVRIREFERCALMKTSVIGCVGGNALDNSSNGGSDSGTRGGTGSGAFGKRTCQAAADTFPQEVVTVELEDTATATVS